MTTERSQMNTFTINHLLTVEGVKPRIAKKETFTSKVFSSTQETKSTKFTLRLHFGRAKENFLSVFLVPLAKEVFVKECTFTALDVNSNELESLTFKDMLVQKFVGLGYDEFFNLSNFSLPDDTICIRCGILFVSESQARSASTEPEVIDFSSADPNLSRDLGKLFSDATDADVTIVVEGRRFMAHKALLKARSDYFRGVFDSNMEESRKNELVIEDADPEDFKYLLEFLYTGLPPKPLFDAAWSLLPLADRFGVLTLKEKCEKAIVSRVSSTNAIEALIIAHTHCCSSLMEKSLPIVRDNLEQLIATAEWEQVRKNADLAALVLESYAKCNSP